MIIEDCFFHYGCDGYFNKLVNWNCNFFHSAVLNEVYRDLVVKVAEEYDFSVCINGVDFQIDSYYRSIK